MHATRVVPIVSRAESQRARAPILLCAQRPWMCIHVPAAARVARDPL